MTPSEQRNARRANASPIETIITQYVECAVSPTGRHKVTATLRANGLLTHLKCECDQEMSDSIVRLGGVSCLQLVNHLRDGLNGSVASYSIKMPGALQGLRSAIDKGLSRKRDKEAGLSGQDNDMMKKVELEKVATKWARQASGLNRVKVSARTLIASSHPLAVYSPDDGGWVIQPDALRHFAMSTASLNSEHACSLCNADMKNQYHTNQHLNRPKHSRRVAEAIRRAITLLTPSREPTPTVGSRSKQWRAAWSFATATKKEE